MAFDVSPLMVVDLNLDRSTPVRSLTGHLDIILGDTFGSAMVPPDVRRDHRSASTNGKWHGRVQLTYLRIIAKLI